MIVLAIDPGPVKSAILYFEDGAITATSKEGNHFILDVLRNFAHQDRELVIESLVSYGLTVGEEVFSTAVWIGRFHEAWAMRIGRDPVLLSRKDVKMNVCGATRVKDKDIREALIQRWGGPEKALGAPKCARCRGLGRRGKAKAPCDQCDGTPWVPGPLHEIAGDQWSALAVAVTFADRVLAAPAAGA